jgi:hypothetical protein
VEMGSWEAREDGGRAQLAAGSVWESRPGPQTLNLNVIIVQWYCWRRQLMEKTTW